MYKLFILSALLICSVYSSQIKTDEKKFDISNLIDGIKDNTKCKVCKTLAGKFKDYLNNTENNFQSSCSLFNEKVKEQVNFIFF